MCGQPFCKNRARWVLLVHPPGGCRPSRRPIRVLSCSVCRRDWESELIDLTHENPLLPVVCYCGHLVGDVADIIIDAKQLVTS